MCPGMSAGAHAAASRAELVMHAIHTVLCPCNWLGPLYLTRILHIFLQAGLLGLAAGFQPGGVQLGAVHPHHAAAACMGPSRVRLAAGAQRRGRPHSRPRQGHSGRRRVNALLSDCIMPDEHAQPGVSIAPVVMTTCAQAVSANPRIRWHACRLLTSLFYLAQCMAPRAATLMRSLLQRCFEAGQPEEGQCEESDEEECPSSSQEDMPRPISSSQNDGAEFGLFCTCKKIS